MEVQELAKAIDWGMISGMAAIFGLVYATFRNLKSDLKDKFDKIDSRFDKIDLRFEKVDLIIDKVNSRFDQVHAEFKEIRLDLTEIKERMAFLEAANIYTMPLQPSEPNPRSQAAREMWKRRRQKSLETKKS